MSRSVGGATLVATTGHVVAAGLGDGDAGSLGTGLGDGDALGDGSAETDGDGDGDEELAGDEDGVGVVADEQATTTRIMEAAMAACRRFIPI
jgi:hypothetical protein